MKGRAAGRRDAAQAWYTSRAPGRQSNHTGTRVVFRLGIERTYAAQERLDQVCERCGVQLHNCRSDKRYCDDCQLDRNRKRAAEQSRRLRIEKHEAIHSLRFPSDVHAGFVGNQKINSSLLWGRSTPKSDVVVLTVWGSGPTKPVRYLSVLFVKNKAAPTHTPVGSDRRTRRVGVG